MRAHVQERVYTGHGGTGEVLSDRTSRGRERPWRRKRLEAEAVAAAYRALGQSDKARRMEECGTVLTFAECPHGHEHSKQLKSANFCRERLCPLCAWRRSLKYGAEAATVLQAAVASRPLDFVMLTLTVRNVPSDELRAAVGRLLRGWKRLTNRAELRHGHVVGWLRTLEVTRHNGRGRWHGTWHPHIHALLAVEPGYWKGRGYISQARWRELWQECCELDYLPVVEVHKVRARRSGDNSIERMAAEVAKYAVKGSDIVGRDHADTAERVRALDSALRGRRLLAWGGLLRRVAQQVLRQESEEDEDLVHVDTQASVGFCPVCGAELVDRWYRWLRDLKQYVDVGAPAVIPAVISERPP